MIAPREDPSPESATETFWAVRCPCTDYHIQYLTEAEYSRQMAQPDSLWQCLRCGGPAEWDDENYERIFEEEDDS